MYGKQQAIGESSNKNNNNSNHKEILSETEKTNSMLN